jgi:hypothetical protein
MAGIHHRDPVREPGDDTQIMRDPDHRGVEQPMKS